ncbi:MAG TPA: phosphotransferase, partial [Chitinophagaceae bacterium]|nr:phosphotransferase [Chitinophagaceae bacterium]
MQELIQVIEEVYKNWKGTEPSSIDILPLSGSERRYFRIHEQGGNTVIATFGLNVRENQTFVYFARLFKDKLLPVPEIFAVNDEYTAYLQEDVGNISLLNILETEGYSPVVYNLFKESLSSLARLQVLGDQDLDYNQCLTNKEFGKQAIMADLLYFKFYFLDALRKPYDKQKLIDDFEALSNYLTHTEFKYFMFRDFQSRNILVNEGQVYFIDFQGGMKGAPQYDVASIIWQAKANLPDDWKQGLLEDYMDSFETIIGKELDRTTFRSQYNGYVLIRLLQVLGAYGFRGLFERKSHFLTSIPQALKNLKMFIEEHSLGITVTEFKRVLDLCVDDEVIQKFTPIQASESTPLVVKICSFSYKRGLPEDTT